jgi:hypothetical protein
MRKFTTFKIGRKQYKACTAETKKDADKIAYKLEKSGFSVKIEEKTDKNGNFVWFDVCGMKEAELPHYHAANIAYCGDGAGFGSNW